MINYVCNVLTDSLQLALPRQHTVLDIAVGFHGNNVTIAPANPQVRAVHFPRHLNKSIAENSIVEYSAV